MTQKSWSTRNRQVEAFLLPKGRIISNEKWLTRIFKLLKKMKHRELSIPIQFSCSSEVLCNPYSNQKEPKKLCKTGPVFSRYINNSVTVYIPPTCKPLLLVLLVQNRCIPLQLLILWRVRPELLIICHFSEIHLKRYNSRPILSLLLFQIDCELWRPSCMGQDNPGLLIEGWLGPFVPTLLDISYHSHCNSVLVF